MTELGLPIVDGAPACPFVAFEDARDDRADRPDPRHRCYAESPPAPRARAHQEAYCLSSNFPVCPTFQDWARREAARITTSAAGGSPAERLRDVPAQREAGARPPAFEAVAAPIAGNGPGPGGSSTGTPGGRSPDPIFPPAIPGAAPGGSLLDRAVGPERGADDDPGHGETAGEPRSPWELPPRRSVQPEWSAPPPWAPSRGAAPDDPIEAPGFLRSGGGGPSPADPGTSRRGATDIEGDDAVPLSGDPSPDRDTAIARLRALGMGATSAGEDDPGGTLARPRPGAGVGRPVEPLVGQSAGVARPAAAGVVENGIVPGSAARAASAEGSGGRSRGGLARLLGWDRRPRAGAAKPARRVDREPAWERPRRFEAYPTLKTRVGVSAPSRLVLAIAALLVAAAVLFFVPPLFLKPSSGTAPGASRSPAASAAAPGASGSAAASAAPSTKPLPTQQTYTVHPGDTLSRIAKRFGVTVEALLAANKNIKNPNQIKIGDVIVIPSPAPSGVVNGAPAASP
jgi:LysM repeat protein